MIKFLDWFLDILTPDEHRYIRPKSTPEKIYRDNKKFCEQRNITLKEIEHDIKEGWLYPSEQPKINFSGTYEESLTDIPIERKSRKRINKVMMENHRGDLQFRISNDKELWDQIDRLSRRYK